MNYRGWLTKVKHLVRRYLFLFIIIISSIVLTFIGLKGKSTIYRDYNIKLWNTPILSVVFEGAGEGRYPWGQTREKMDDTTEILSQVGSNLDGVHTDQTSEINRSSNKTDTREVFAVSNNNDKEIHKKSKTDKGTSFNKTPKKATDNSKNSNKKESKKEKDVRKTDKGNKEDFKNVTTDKNQKNNETDNVSPSPAIDEQLADNSIVNESVSDHGEIGTNKEEDKDTSISNQKFNSDRYQKVSREYFDDALFIGDSRTVGLSEYSDLDNSTFYADVGLNIYDLFDRKIAKVDGKKETILTALNQKQFKKIYIMLGINELGTGTTKSFTEEYQSALAKIQKLQPDAIIFIEGIMNVGKEKSNKDPIFNNKNIRKRNKSLARLADNKHMFYLDVNEAIIDKSGNLPEGYTFDSIHLKAPYYKLWTNYLLRHGIVFND